MIGHPWYLLLFWHFGAEETDGSTIYRDAKQHFRKFAKKVVVVHLAHTRGHCSAFWPSIPPLQVAPSIACSVASLSRCPGLQLPRPCSLRHKVSTDYLLGWGEPSTCFAGHAVLQCTPSPKHGQEVSLPAQVFGRQVLFRIRKATAACSLAIFFRPALIAFGATCRHSGATQARRRQPGARCQRHGPSVTTWAAGCPESRGGGRDADQALALYLGGSAAGLPKNA